MEENESVSDPRAKIEAIVTASLQRFPVGDIDQMLREIEAGYLGSVDEATRCSSRVQ